MPELLLFAVVYGIDWIATVPPTVNRTASIYGRASVGTFDGWIFSDMLGASLAARAAGFFHEPLGDYHLVIISATTLGFVASRFSMGIRRPAPRRGHGPGVNGRIRASRCARPRARS